MQGTPQELSSRAPAEREELIQGDTTDYFKGTLHPKIENAYFSLLLLIYSLSKYGNSRIAKYVIHHP